MLVYYDYLQNFIHKDTLFFCVNLKCNFIITCISKAQLWIYKKMAIKNEEKNMNNSTSYPPRNAFHESRDSVMDKRLPKRSFLQKYKYYLLAGVAFLAFLVFVIVSVSGGRKLRVDNERIVIADVSEAPFLDYVDAEGIVQPIQTIKLNSLETGMVQEVVAEEGAIAVLD